MVTFLHIVKRFQIDEMLPVRSPVSVTEDGAGWVISRIQAQRGTVTPPRSHSPLVEEAMFPPTSPAKWVSRKERMRGGFACLSSWPTILAGAGHGRKLQMRLWKGRRRDWSGRNIASSEGPSRINILKVGPQCYFSALSPTVFTAFCDPSFLPTLSFFSCSGSASPTGEHLVRRQGPGEPLPSLHICPLAQAGHLAAARGIYFGGKETHSSMNW